MLRFIDTPTYDAACRAFAQQVADFMRAAQKNQRSKPAFLESGTCVPFPRAVANDVYQSLKRMDLRWLNVQLLRLVMDDNVRRSDWDCAFAKLFRALADLEQVWSGNGV
jgi:hypothetical protein